MDFFSDREQGRRAATTNEISVSVWNGVVAIFENFVSENLFSKQFSEQCYDNKGVVSCDITLLNDKLKALIPNIEVPIKRRNENQESVFIDWSEPKGVIQNQIDTIAVLDFIEFCFININDVTRGRYHEYFDHYHLQFPDTYNSRQIFRQEINSLFERNGLTFTLREDGKIIRIHTPELSKLISTHYNTADEKLNGLLEEALSFFILPRSQNISRAVEKVWDAFERLKTYLHNDKKASINQLIKLIGNGNEPLERYIESETKLLTEIGNNFQIRHFEKGRQEINDEQHLIYLFHRLLALINLMISKLSLVS